MSADQVLVTLGKGNAAFSSDRPIIPAVLRAMSSSGKKGEELLDAAVCESVRRTVGRLRNSEPSLSEALRTGAVEVVGARCDLGGEKVDDSAVYG